MYIHSNYYSFYSLIMYFHISNILFPYISFHSILFYPSIPPSQSLPTPSRMPLLKILPKPMRTKQSNNSKYVFNNLISLPSLFSNNCLYQLNDLMFYLSYRPSLSIYFPQQEFFADYYASSPDLLSLNVEGLITASNTPNPDITKLQLDRTVDGICSCLLSLKRQPYIRYVGKSDLVQKVIYYIRLYLFLSIRIPIFFLLIFSKHVGCERITKTYICRSSVV